MTKHIIQILVVSTFLLLSSMIVMNITSSAATERTFTVAYSEPIDSPNPFVGITDTSYHFFALIYDYLIAPNESLEPSPDLAASWWYMNGSTAVASGTDLSGQLFSNPADWPLGSIWEYNLTDKAYWSDGVPFTSIDVKFTLDIQIGAYFMTYWAYQPYTRWIDHVDVIGDYKVRIFFSDYDSKTPTPLAFGNNLFIPIMPKHPFEGKPSTYIAQEWNGLPAIGTGPFMGTANLGIEIIAKEEVNLVRNPYYNFLDSDSQPQGLGGYYGKSTEIQRYVMKFFSEESTLAISIKTGNCDAGRLTASTYLTWLSDPTLPDNIDLQSTLSPTGYSKQIGINDYSSAPGSLNVLRLDPAVQRALALATDKNYIKDAVYKGLADIGYGLITPVTPEWYWEPGTTPSTFNVYDENGAVIYSYTKPLNEVMEYDIAEANRLLTAAGYVWANESGVTVRKASLLAAERMFAMGFAGDVSSVLNKKLIFEHIVMVEIFEDKEVGDFLVGEWEKIGVWISTNYDGGTHSISLVNVATWNTLIYSYLYNTMQTYWSGDIDPNYLCYIPTSYALFGWNEFGTNETEYDNLYLETVTSFNYTERKFWVDECSKWQYLSGSIITTVYPRTCWAWNEEDWTNQGNWSNMPGMSMESYWPENPLLFRIHYAVASNQPPAAVITGESSGIVGEMMAFSGASSHDPDGTIVKFNWTFDDSPICLHSSSIARKWATPGSHWVKLTVTDDSGALNSTISYVEISTGPSENGTSTCIIKGRCIFPEEVNSNTLHGYLISKDENATFEFSIHSNGSFFITEIEKGNYSLIIKLNSSIVLSMNLSIPGASTIVNLGDLEIASADADGGETISILDANPYIAFILILGMILSAAVAVLEILRIVASKKKGGGNP